MTWTLAGAFLGDTVKDDDAPSVHEDSVEGLAPIVYLGTLPHEHQAGTSGALDAHRVMNPSGGWPKRFDERVETRHKRHRGI